MKKYLKSSYFDSDFLNTLWIVFGALIAIAIGVISENKHANEVDETIKSFMNASRKSEYQFSMTNKVNARHFELTHYPQDSLVILTWVNGDNGKESYTLKGSKYTALVQDFSGVYEQNLISNQKMYELLLHHNIKIIN